MKTAVFGSILLLIVLVIGMNLRTVRTARTQEPAEEGSIMWYVQQAKAKGKNRIEMGPTIVEYGGSSKTTNLKVALSLYNLLVATPIQQVTLPYESSEIITWSKFKSLEALSKTPTATLTKESSATPPTELLPVAEDEFVIAQIGGSLKIDDVTVIKPAEYTPFIKGERYVLFLQRSPSGKAEIAGGPIGSFHLRGNGSIQPLSKREHPLVKDLREQFGNSLLSLRESIKGKS